MGFEDKNERNQINIFTDFIQNARGKEKIDVYLKRQDAILFEDEMKKIWLCSQNNYFIFRKNLEIKIKYNLLNIVIIKLK